MVRKKKRGAKKKKAAHVYRGLSRPYHIITSNRGIQIKDIYSGVSLEKTIAKMKFLQAELNKNVEFPVRFTSCHYIKDTFVEAEYNLIIIKKKSDTDSETNQLRNEYGKFVDYNTDNANWIVLDKVPYNMEESFWVYGFNPKNDRKTYRFIFSTYVELNSDNKYFFKQIAIYKNKLLIDSVDGLNMVLCKNHQDSVRLYNAIADEAKEKNFKYVLFSGDITIKSFSYANWFNKIKELTNWTDRKIKKSTTRNS